MTPPDDIIAAAQTSQFKTGIPASIIIAQWALESGWGKYMPPDSNNPFGIKAVGDEPFVSAPTHEFVNGKVVTVDANFRKFDTIADAFAAHAELLTTSRYYANARKFENEPEQFANALTGVYATNPNYGSLLISIIHGSNLRQYDKPLAVDEAAAQSIQLDAAGEIDKDRVVNLVSIASDHNRLQAAQSIAAQRLLQYDGEKYPSDGCAITLSVILQDAGIGIKDTFGALALVNLLEQRGWQKIAVGSQQKGDIGTTCGDVPHHGTDHVYLVLQTLNLDEMIIADNQQPQPHFRFASGKGRSPTTFFLRAA